MNLESYIEKVHKSIGENILLFQKLEGLLKYINLHFNLDLKNYDSNKFNNHTMGMLVNDHFNFEEKKTEFYNNKCQISLHLELSKDYCKKKESIFKNLLEKRNDLVHQSFLKYDLSSIESCKGILNELQDMQEKISLELLGLESVVTDIQSSKENFKNFLLNDETIEIY